MGDRPEKKAIIDEIRQRLAEGEFLILADCRGLKVEGMTELRGQLDGAHSRLVVSKNSFIGRALEDIGWTDVVQFLDGPTAVITGTGEVSGVAKLLRDYAKTRGLPTLKGGRFGEQTLTSEDIDTFANLPSREVLLGQVVGTIAAPMTQLVGVFQQKVLSLLYVLKAAAEKKGT